MSGTTISGSYLSSITLGNAATQNPATVAAGSTLGGGLIGTSGTYWTIANSGVINNGASGTIGISLAGGGDIFNEIGATVSGISSGIILGGSGYITNAASALITGASSGISVSGAGTIANSGTIMAGSDGGDTGVWLRHGGSITNAVSGVIEAWRAINVGYGTATVVNYGAVLATGVGNGGHGIWLAGGGSVTNGLSATIGGGGFGVQIYGGSGTLINAGNISGRLYGVTLGAANGGYLYNKAGASIRAQDYIGVNVFASYATIINAGTIAGKDDSDISGIHSLGDRHGVLLRSGGYVTNMSRGSIVGGVGIEGAPGVVINSGTIATDPGVRYPEPSGVNLQQGGYITNAVSGYIGGAVGIYLAGGTVTNSGTITGRGGTAVSFYGTAGGCVVGDPGAVFNGDVVGSTSAKNVLELASGAAVGTISGIGTSFVNFKSLIVDSGAKWELTGDNTLAAGSTLTNGGTLTLAGATLSDAGRIINNGHIELDPSTLGVASLSGTGTVTIDAGSTLSVQGAVSSGQDIVFAGAGAKLDLGGPSLFSGTLTGFADSDVIDLTAVADVAGSHADMDYATNILTVTEGGNTYHFQFDKTNFAGDFFHLISQDGGTLIEENQIACYARGTRIATDRGEVPVEELAIGEKVLTASGALRPVKWIGRRSYGGRFIMGRKDILPVCFRQGSLGEKVPRRDLLVSPHHAMYLEGVLVEARDLVDGISIVQVSQVDHVDYFHIELETHDVILAEGVPSETFIDDDSRAMFHNVHEYVARYPGDARRPARYCAPRLDSGYELEAIRQRLARRRPPSRAA